MQQFAVFVTILGARKVEREKENATQRPHLRENQSRQAKSTNPPAPYTSPPPIGLGRSRSQSLSKSHHIISATFMSWFAKPEQGN